MKTKRTTVLLAVAASEQPL